jgi:hypothetical protein
MRMWGYRLPRRTTKKKRDGVKFDLQGEGDIRVEVLNDGVDVLSGEEDERRLKVHRPRVRRFGISKKENRRIGGVRGRNSGLWRRGMVNGRNMQIFLRRRSLVEVEVVAGERNTALLNFKLGSQRCVVGIPSRTKPVKHKMMRGTRMALQLVILFMRVLMKDQPKVDKSKIVDVDRLFALDTPIESASTGPPSSVFFDSAPTTGRGSRFVGLFAQDPPPQPAPQDPQMRPNVDRIRGNQLFEKPDGSSAKDREGFQRIMAMLGGDQSQHPNISNVLFTLTQLISGNGKTSTATTAAAYAGTPTSRRLQSRFLPTSPSARTTNGTKSASSVY